MTIRKPLQRGALSGEQVVAAKETGDAISRFLSADTPLSVTFARPTGERLETTIPTFALKILAEVLSEAAHGTQIIRDPHPAELTTHQAAGLLHVSRPYLIKLLEQGQIAHRKVGRHRRVRYDDLQDYLEKERAARRKTLAELAAYDQEIGLGDFAEE